MCDIPHLAIVCRLRHADIDLLEQELARLRSDGRRRHAQLVDELGKALQGRDAAVGSLQRLEVYCQQNNWDLKQLSSFQVSFYST